MLQPAYGYTVRTTSDDPRFRALTAKLDDELAAIYGEVQKSYHGYNQFSCDTVIVLDGACGCFKRYDDTTAELKRMYVSPALRRQGLAAKVVGECEAWARELGFATMILETGNLQHAAIALYGRLGYEVTPPFGVYAHMPASVCMRKSI